MSHTWHFNLGGIFPRAELHFQNVKTNFARVHKVALATFFFAVVQNEMRSSFLEVSHDVLRSLSLSNNP